MILPAKTSQRVWILSCSLCRAIRNAMRNARTSTMELFAKKTITVHEENAIAA